MLPCCNRSRSGGRRDGLKKGEQTKLFMITNSKMVRFASGLPLKGYKYPSFSEPTVFFHVCQGPPLFVLIPFSRFQQRVSLYLLDVKNVAILISTRSCDCLMSYRISYHVILCLVVCGGLAHVRCLATGAGGNEVLPQ